MFGSSILDVAIGMVLIYLLLSLIASSLREAIETWLKSRSAQLERGLRELLNDKSGSTLVKAVYAHPLISALYRGQYTPAISSWWASRRSTLPSYIPARNFALALTDIVVRGEDAANPAQASSDAPRIDLATIRANIASIGNPEIQRVLLTALDNAAGDINRFYANLQNWYDSSMDRVAGWYKRETQVWLFAIGASLAVGLNVDTTAVAKYLYSNSGARDALVAEATAVARDTAFKTADVKVVTGELKNLQLPIGWTDATSAPLSTGAASLGVWLSTLAGWAITALAISFGAPFWFDALNRITVIRSTVKPHEKSPEEGSKDGTSTVAPAPAAVAPAPVQIPASVLTPASIAAPATQPVVQPVGASPVTPQATLPANIVHQWASGQPDEGIL